MTIPGKKTDSPEKGEARTKQNDLGGDQQENTREPIISLDLKTQCPSCWRRRWQSKIGGRAIGSAHSLASVSGLSVAYGTEMTPSLEGPI